MRVSSPSSIAMEIAVSIVHYAHSFRLNGSPPSAQPCPIRRRERTVFCMQAFAPPSEILARGSVNHHLGDHLLFTTSGGVILSSDDEADRWGLVTLVVLSGDQM